MVIDINTLRSVITLVSMLVFLGIVAWSWSRRRDAAFSAAASLPLLEDDVANDTASDTGARS